MVHIRVRRDAVARATPAFVCVGRSTCAVVSCMPRPCDNRRMVFSVPAVASDFPFHCQRHPMGCSLACFRMLEEWATGAAHAEEAWRGRVEGTWTTGGGFPPDALAAALREHLGHALELEVLAPDALPPLPERFERARHALVLFVDSWKHRPNGVTNVGHYVLLHAFLRGTPRPLQRADGETKPVACYHDPATGPDRLWTWQSMITPAPHVAILARRR